MSVTSTSVAVDKWLHNMVEIVIFGTQEGSAIMGQVAIRTRGRRVPVRRAIGRNPRRI